MNNTVVEILTPDSCQAALLLIIHSMININLIFNTRNHHKLSGKLKTISRQPTAASNPTLACKYKLVMLIWPISSAICFEAVRCIEIKCK